MRTLQESIIGRRGSQHGRSKSKELKCFEDLEYGDIVIIQNRALSGSKYYIYLPKGICYLLFNRTRLREDAFVTCNLNNNMVPLSYWKADGFNHFDFPFFTRKSAEIVSCEGHVQEYYSIKTEEDVKRIFNKYNLPIS